MGYAKALPNPGKGRFYAMRAAAVSELSIDPMLGPTKEALTDVNGQDLDLSTGL
jgi:hypothetical protein